MPNKSIIFFLGLSPIIPIVAHLAEGLIFVVEFWLLFSVAILMKTLIDYLEIKKAVRMIQHAGIFLASALYAQTLNSIFPVIMISIESYIYIFVLSYILIISIKGHDTSENPFELPVMYSFLLLIVSLLRELFVFGTVSIPIPSGLFSIKIIPFASPLTFWGSGAGVLILFGIGLWLFNSFQKGELLPFRTYESGRNRL